MKKVSVLGFLLLLTTVAYSAPSSLSTEEEGALADMGIEQVRGAPPMLDFTLDDLTGKKIQLSSLKGKVILVNFWATWCPPCRAEMPGMEKLYQTLKSNPDFVMLAVDSQEDPATVKAFIEKNKYHFPVLLDQNGTVTAQYSIRAFPTSYIIDRKGRVIGGVVGARAWETPGMLKGLQKLLQMR